MPLIYLIDKEIQAITGKRQRTAQVRALSYMGIEYKIRPDGRPLVSRLTFERTMGNTANTLSLNDNSPDFDALTDGT